MGNEKAATAWELARHELQHALKLVKVSEAELQRAWKTAQGKVPPAGQAVAAVVAVKEAVWELKKAAAAADEALIEYRRVLVALERPEGQADVVNGIYNTSDFL